MIFYTFIKDIPFEFQQKLYSTLKTITSSYHINHAYIIYHIYYIYMSFMAKHDLETLYQMTTTNLMDRKTTGHREWVLHNIFLFLLFLSVGMWLM